MQIYSCSKIAQNIFIQQVVSGFILKMKQLILMLMLLMVTFSNFSAIRANYSEILNDEGNGILKNTKTAVPLKYFKNFGSHLKSHLLIAKSN